ncbi:hypothetical protein Q0Z83_011970 [Actinoplanes sichuanensis]|uniref:Uncharacterized protein n=1 Tax=Actinoplanes sichuanensis TaxID=512349 RepID=A0ABW4A5C7_9ACTN|nr:hypothetical protein [Actinoplanes sichuanensis]BEL03006.1 hypothetical protein Q0Z83_011970 [Actinoplanes sichuanensis]
MSQQNAPDPFDGLQDWAAETEKKVRRERVRRAVAGRVPMVVVGVAALVALGFAVPAGWAMLRDDTGSAAEPNRQPADGVSEEIVADGSINDPFAGTAAATYPKGEAGIDLPTAKAVTGFGAAQVDAALKQVRRAMIAGRLDSTMLVDHDPDELLALIAPNQRAAISRWFSDRVHTNLATWIDPAVRLDPDQQPRVSGRITYTSAVRDGRRELRVTTNFVWVYAFKGTTQPIAVVHDENQWEFPATKNLRADDRGMWIGNTRSYLALMDCAAGDRGLLAPYRMGAVGNPAATEDPEELVRADHSLDIQDGCP